jgi:8-oxo-dGTP diphosphatase
MELPHRIAAGGLVFREDSILLVRYRGIREGETFLAAPGGGLRNDENIAQAVVREIREETGITVAPRRLLAIEDIRFPELKMIKLWMLCDLREGELRRTEDAVREGILETAWFPRDRLAGESVHPELVLRRDWDILRHGESPVEILPSREVPDGPAYPHRGGREPGIRG